MKNTLLLLFCLLLHLFLNAGSGQRNTSGQFTIVELFTSEGCSSCPAADRLLAGLANDEPQNLIVLGFHVDYWNRLGWKDRFSDQAYSERQRRYAAAIPKGEVYTPQAIINGSQEMVGSDRTRLQSAIAENKLIPGNIPIHVTAMLDKENIIVDYSYGYAPGRILNIALVQSDAVTDVLAGENKGKKLHHVNVVRAFEVASNPVGKTKLKIPVKATAKEYKIVAYVQDERTMRVLATSGYTAVNQ